MPPMSFLRTPAFRHYALGLAGIVAGAGFTSASGSMWPLALGSAPAVTGTWALVREIRERAARRRQQRRRR
ncbi:MAG: hypothetical protein MZW92_30070 [Comamonadaceae bacterium]|nr:hypothetical protein [Comamonadaceae bacterium]